MAVESKYYCVLFDKDNIKIKLEFLFLIDNIDFFDIWIPIWQCKVNFKSDLWVLLIFCYEFLIDMNRIISFSIFWSIYGSLAQSKVRGNYKIIRSGWHRIIGQIWTQSNYRTLAMALGWLVFISLSFAVAVLLDNFSEIKLCFHLSFIIIIFSWIAKIPVLYLIAAFPVLYFYLS